MTKEATGVAQAQTGKADKIRVDNDFDMLRTLVDNIREYAIIMLDPKGHVTTWSPTAERLKGYRAEEIVGKHFSTFYTREDVASGKTDRELETAVRDGRARHG